MDAVKEKKPVAINKFVDELIARIDRDQDIGCCREEIKVFARYASKRIGDETIEIAWKD